MDDGYTIYRCCTCNKCFILFANDVTHSEQESKYITCPYHGYHKNICVVGKYEGIKDCTGHDSYKRSKGSVKQKGWN